MICDDEREVLLLFGLVFGSKYHVIKVDSGEECIERYMEETNRGNNIHLILLDYKLGSMPDSQDKRIQRNQNNSHLSIQCR
jgi:CheY-like chemotaxis protein